jgi:hypothetical protein
MGVREERASPAATKSAMAAAEITAASAPRRPTRREVDGPFPDSPVIGVSIACAPPAAAPL